MKREAVFKTISRKRNSDRVCTQRTYILLKYTELL